MKHIINFRHFSLNEGLTPEQIQVKIRNEKNFINIMKERCDALLTDEEKDMDHPIHNFILDYIYSVYDNNRFDEKSLTTGLTEDDYNLALIQIKARLDEAKSKKRYFKELEAHNKRKERARMSGIDDDDDE